MISNKPKSKQRYLSPSFKKGAIKKEKDKEEEFKLNLILNGAEDDDSESPKSPKKAGKRLSLQTDQRQNMPSPQSKMPSKKHKSVVDKAIIDITSKTNNISLGNKLIKKIGSFSQAGKGEDGFTKVNQDSFFVVQNEFKMANFNIFCVLDGHGMNGHLISGFATKYFTSHINKNKKLMALETEEDIYKILNKNNYDIIHHMFTHYKKKHCKK